jgi:hypothetical protein
MYGSKPRTVGESPKRASAETRRRVRETVEAQKETGRCVTAPWNTGIRSGEKSEECTVPEANASERRNPSEILRGTSWPAVIQGYRWQPSRAHGASRERPATRWGTGTKPSPCSNRDFDWMDRRAWNRSISYSAGLASSPTCSPRIASPTGRPSQRK